MASHCVSGTRRYLKCSLIDKAVFKKKIKIFNIGDRSYASSTERDTPIIAVSHLTTLYHVDHTEHSISDIVEYLNSALVGDAGEVGTAPVVVFNSSLAQLTEKKKQFVSN